MDGETASLEVPPETQRNLTTAECIDLTDKSEGDTCSSKLTTLRNFIEEDLLAADLKWSLFVAACQSYKYDSCVKPFPPQFIQNGVKNIDGLREVIDMTPPLGTLIQKLKDPHPLQLNYQVIDTLHWALLRTKDIKLATVPKREFKAILDRAHHELPVQPPNYIFEVMIGPTVASEVKWTKLRENRKTMFAFHGSKLENFHSIIHHGLQQHMNKTALFGEGIYLSSEPSVSLPYSTTGHSWSRSELGGGLSCIALCEVIDHPDMKYQAGDVDRSRAITQNSIGGEIPPKYYLVQNSELVRVRNLLVYTNKSPVSSSNGRLVSWISKNKMSAFLIGYILLLVSISLSNSNIVNKYFRMLQKKFGW